MRKLFWSVIEKLCSSKGARGPRLTPENLAEAIRDHLPKYLSEEELSQVCGDFAQFPNLRRFYASTNSPNECVQGDGWTGFSYPSFEEKRWLPAKGLVLSNSCDIALENKPDPYEKILFSPLIRLGKFLEMLEREAGYSAQQLGDLAKSIRSQEVSDIFYLPAFEGGEEVVVLLDDIHSHPIGDYYSGEPQRLFSLSESCFLLLLLKLSIHFTRIQGGDPVIRTALA